MAAPNKMPPMLFGRRMKPLTVKEAGWYLWVGPGIQVVVRRSIDPALPGWNWSLACPPQWTPSLYTAMRLVRARARELVENIGPCVGWAPSKPKRTRKGGR